MIFNGVDNYSALHREAHRRVFPWLAAPLIARQICLVPSWKGLKLDREARVQAFEQILATFDPCFLGENDTTLSDNDVPETLKPRTLKDWHFIRGSNKKSENGMGPSGTPPRDLPLNLLLEKPFATNSVAYPIADNEFTDASCETLWDDCLQAIIRGDVYSEHMTLTQIFELKLNPTFFEKMGFAHGSPEYNLATELMGLAEGNKALPMVFQRGSAEREPSKDIKKLLYECVWEKLDELIDARQDRLWADSDIPKPFECFSFFGDFRLVMPTYPRFHYPKFTAEDGPQGKRKLLEPDRVAAFAISHGYTGPEQKTEPKWVPAGKDVKLGFFEKQLRNEKPFTDHDAAASRALAEYWPLWADDAHDRGETEIVANTFMDNSVLYVSTLGFEAVHDVEGTEQKQTDHDSSPKPLRLLMVSALNDPWQAARFVFRILALGNSRLMAVRQIRHVYLAEQSLKALDSEIQSATRTSSGAAVYVWIQGMLGTIPYNDTLLTRRAVFEDFAHILKYGTRVTASTNGQTPFVGGLQHRISRSIYHSKAFRSRVGDLKENPITGYQGYSELMRRRLYATFDRVAQLDELTREVRENLATYESTLRRRQLRVVNGLLIPTSIATVLGFVIAFLTNFDPLCSDSEIWAFVFGSFCAAP
jgi:hypothetical protein